MEKLFDYLKMDHCKNNNFGMFPVYAIDGLQVQFLIEKQNDAMRVVVSSPYKIRTLYKKTLTCVNDLKEFVEVDLKEMKLNLLTSLFETDKMRYPAEVCDLFEGNPNIEPSRTECSVCMGPTFARLSECKHPLCIRCEVKITRNGNNRCPICRGKFYNEIMEDETSSETESE